MAVTLGLRRSSPFARSVLAAEVVLTLTTVVIIWIVVTCGHASIRDPLAVGVWPVPDTFQNSGLAGKSSEHDICCNKAEMSDFLQSRNVTGR